MADKAILYDATRCTACRGCQAACKNWNENDEEIPTEENGVGVENTGSYENPPSLSASTWNKIKFTEVERGDKLAWLFTRQACMHCTKASCLNVCPTGAISQVEGGFVLIDQEWCIGCGYCVQACPFDAPHKDEHAGTARKCTACIDRTTNGYEPACVKTCPTDALVFGDRDTLLTGAKESVQALGGNAYLYGDEELGGLHVLYVLDDAPDVYGLPVDPQLATKNAVGQWLSGILTAGLITALPFWFLFKRKRELESSQGGARR